MKGKEKRRSRESSRRNRPGKKEEGVLRENARCISLSRGGRGGALTLGSFQIEGDRFTIASGGSKDLPATIEKREERGDGDLS